MPLSRAPLALQVPIASAPQDKLSPDLVAPPDRQALRVPPARWARRARPARRARRARQGPQASQEASGRPATQAPQGSWEPLGRWARQVPRVSRALDRLAHLVPRAALALRAAWGRWGPLGPQASVLTAFRATQGRLDPPACVDLPVLRDSPEWPQIRAPQDPQDPQGLRTLEARDLQARPVRRGYPEDWGRAVQPGFRGALEPQEPLDRAVPQAFLEG